VGVSSPRPSDGPAGSVDGGHIEASPIAADFRSRMARLSGRFVSRGHGERFEAVVWANDRARDAWAAPVDMPDGAVLVEEAIERAAGDDRQAGLLVMVKHGDAWRFVAVGPDGEVVGDARVAPCTECHREAPRDSVFPLASK
jgi:hypothetical protein